MGKRYEYQLTDDAKAVLAKAEGGKPETISAADFVAGDYAAKIAAGECRVEIFGFHPVMTVMEWQIVNSVELTEKEAGKYWIVTSVNSFPAYYDRRLRVTWLDTAQANAAKAAGGEADFEKRVPSYKDETWYGIGYNDGYGDAQAELTPADRESPPSAVVVDPVEAMRLRAEDAIAARLKVESELTRLRTAIDAERATVALLREALENLLSVTPMIKVDYQDDIYFCEYCEGETHGEGRQRDHEASSFVHEDNCVLKQAADALQAEAVNAGALPGEG